MKKDVMFAGFFLFSVSFVSGQEIFCTDNDGGKNYYEKGDVNFVSLGENKTLQDKCYNEKTLLEYFCEDNMMRNENFDCSDGCSEGVCIIDKMKDAFCKEFDWGAYGKRDIFSEFVTKENFCVLTEWINSSQLDTKSQYTPEGKEATEFGDAAAWYHENQDTFLVRCLNNNCDSTRVNECEGRNCGLMTNACRRSRLGGLSEAQAIKYYLLHPIQFFRDYNTLFKKTWNENQGFLVNFIMIDVRGVQEKYSDGTTEVLADWYTECVNGKTVKSPEDLVIEKNESYCDAFPDKCG